MKAQIKKKKKKDFFFFFLRKSKKEFDFNSTNSKLQKIKI